MTALPTRPHSTPLTRLSRLTRLQPAAPVGRTFALVGPIRESSRLTTLLGSGAMAADIGLIATAAWLVSTAAQHPNQAELALAIVGVQFFGLSRGFLRYGERLIGHVRPSVCSPTSGCAPTASSSGWRRQDCWPSGGVTC